MADVRVPAEIAWLVGIVGQPAALRLLEERGGTRVYLPRRVGEDSVLARELGLEPARALVEHLGGNRPWKVPSCKRWRVQVMFARGMTCREVALAVRLDEKTVRTYRDAPKADAVSPQMALPLV